MSKIGLVAVAGIIGVGKTTLAEELAGMLGGRLILEEYGQNPFLPGQLAGQYDAALPNELYFLLSRARQLHKENIKDEPVVVCDYIFQKNRLFAQLNLDDRQLAIYDEVERTIVGHVRAPDVVIYLYDTVASCLDRIRRRGRHFEKEITTDFLAELSGAYERLLDDWRLCPVLRVDCSRCDLRERENIKAIAEELASKKSVCRDCC